MEKKLDALQGRAVWREQIKPWLVYPKTPAGGRALLAVQGILQEHTSKGSSDPDLFTGGGKAEDKKCKKKKNYIKMCLANDIFRSSVIASGVPLES